MRSQIADLLCHKNYHVCTFTGNKGDKSDDGGVDDKANGGGEDENNGNGGDNGGTDETDIKEAFSLLDSDGSGSISAAECGTVIRSLGHNPTDEEIQDLLKVREPRGRKGLTFLGTNSIHTVCGLIL